MSEAEASETAPEGDAKEPEGDAKQGDGVPGPASVRASNVDPPREDAPPEQDFAAHADGAGRIAGWAAVALVVATVAAMLVGLLLSLVRGPQGPWLGEYYENQDFEGDPTIRYARKVEFDYKKGAPFAGMPKDHWSVTWTTCMDIEESTEVRFRVASDDGSRLYVDDELLIDNWGAHATRTRTGKVTLEPGPHYLQLDYFEDRHGAIVKLEAAMDDGEATSISPEILRQPDDGACE